MVLHEHHYLYVLLYFCNIIDGAVDRSIKFIELLRHLGYICRIINQQSFLIIIHIINLIINTLTRIILYFRFIIAFVLYSCIDCIVYLLLYLYYIDSYALHNLLILL